MTIAKRLYLLITFVAVCLSGLAGIGIYQMNRVYVAANYANINTVPSIVILDEAFGALANLRVFLWQYLATTDGAQKEQLRNRMNEMSSDFIKALNKYEKECLSDEKDRSLLQADLSAFGDYTTLRESILALGKEGKAEEGMQLLLKNQAVLAKLANAFQAHRDYNTFLGQKGADDGATMLKSANSLAVVIALIALIGVTGMGLLLSRKIINSLNEAVVVAQTVAAGDLTYDIKVTGNDEVGRLMRALKEMNISLLKIVGEVRSGTETISTASTQIATGNLDLSTRTEQQAGSLEETASSMEELTSTVRQNADNARQANTLAVSASDMAVKGGAVVSQVVERMGTINESAKKIVDIISVIDGIAFQTNILALNAAVEAARAGEQGRGFAVVASEVRNLAQRSAAAAKEIKSLIDKSVDQVAAGSRLVDEAGSAMHDIVESVRRVTDVVSEISAASQEQTSGIEQINKAIIHMDEVTQQNAALVEEAAAAAASLQDQASNLSVVVSVFQIAKIDRSVPGESAVKPANRQAPRKESSDKNISLRNVMPAMRLSSANNKSGSDWQEF